MPPEAACPFGLALIHISILQRLFLAHNSQDKPLVKAISEELKKRGLKPWLDEEQILGGEAILEAVYDGISQSKAGAFFISSNGLGPFQEDIELYTVINLFLKRKSKGFRVIPILLPGISKIPEKVEYLAIWRWIEFKQRIDEVLVLDDLERSIKGREPDRSPNLDKQAQNSIPIKAIKVLLKLRSLDLKKRPGLSELLDWVGYLEAVKTPVEELDRLQPPCMGALLKQESDRQRAMKEAFVSGETATQDQDT